MKTDKEISSSVGSIYNALLEKRRAKEEEKREERLRKEEERLKEKEEAYLNPDSNQVMSKKEKAQLALDSWREVVVGLTGDDLEYVSEKKSKKKYRQWLGEDEEIVAILSDKPKKRKKRNYNKEFEPELNMLKSIVSDQNKFTVDLQRRYTNAAGPVGKEASPLNRNLVELASVINNSRSNSLSLLREIGNIKKTIADLYMKQKKLDSELGGEGFNTQDLGLMGSNIAASMLNTPFQPMTAPVETPVIANPIKMDAPVVTIEEFDPNKWSGDGLDAGHAKYEAIPHSIVVEWHKDKDVARFKAIKNSDGSELIGAPVPTCKVKSFDEKDMWAKDEFDQVYRLEIL